MTTANDVLQLIGHTPLLELKAFCRAQTLDATILAKLEMQNPGGSIKDRVAYAMIVDAETKGRLRPGGTVIEPTSGNTGIGLAMVAAARGYRAVLFMPDTMSVERRQLIAAYGAEIVLTPGKDGMKGAIAAAEKMATTTENSIIAGQFDNPANPQAHYDTTGPELWQGCGGRLDIFVCAVGSGGTISGTGRYLKEQNPALRIVAVEPQRSAVLSGGCAGPHGIQGIGAGFVPGNLDTAVYDEVVAVRDEDALAFARSVAKVEGVSVGISSGAALWAAAELAKRPENRNCRIATIFPDGGGRYLSSGLYAM